MARARALPRHAMRLRHARGAHGARRRAAHAPMRWIDYFAARRMPCCAVFLHYVAVTPIFTCFYHHAAFAVTIDADDDAIYDSQRRLIDLSISFDDDDSSAGLIIAD